MKKLVSFAVLSLTACILVSFFSCTAQTPKANLKTDIDSLSYAYGINITTQGLDQYFQQMGIEEADKSEFIKGFLEGAQIAKDDKKANVRIEGMAIGKQVVTSMFANINQSLFSEDSTQSLNKSQFLAGFVSAVLNKDLLINKDEAMAFVQTKSDEIQAKINEKVYGPIKAENQAFLDENKSKPGVITLPSGLQYKVELEGKGPKPASAEELVRVKYKGTDIHGKEFDGNDNMTFQLDRVIPGWTEGIQLMSVGSKYTLYIPYDIAYGAAGRKPTIEPFATLIFDVELLEIVKK